MSKTQKSALDLRRQIANVHNTHKHLSVHSTHGDAQQARRRKGWTGNCCCRQLVQLCSVSPRFVWLWLVGCRFLVAYVIRSTTKSSAEPSCKSILTQRQRSANWAKDSRKIYRVAAIPCVANPLHRFVGPNVEPNAPRCLVVLPKWCTRRAELLLYQPKAANECQRSKGERESGRVDESKRALSLDARHTAICVSRGNMLRGKSGGWNDTWTACLPHVNCLMFTTLTIISNCLQFPSNDRACRAQNIEFN